MLTLVETCLLGFIALHHGHPWLWLIWLNWAIWWCFSGLIPYVGVVGEFSLARSLAFSKVWFAR
jgi:hypothetical protein